jgi:hypothetical protein
MKSRKQQYSSQSVSLQPHASAFKSKSSLTMDALIDLNRRELALQSELEEIRRQKVALLATLVKPAPKAAPTSTGLLTPTKVKAAASAVAPPPAPKKALITLTSGASESESSGVARKITISARRASSSTAGSVSSKSSTSSAPAGDAVLKHWKAFKKTKHEQITAAANGWGKARVKTAIQNAYQLEHPANAAVLEQLLAAKNAAKEPRAPSEWLQFVAAVRTELGCSHKDAMAEAGRRRRVSAE